MKCWNCRVLLVLSGVFCFRARVESSSVGSINMKITNTSSTINVTWEPPDKSKNPLCYRSNLQYRSHCDSSWQNFKNIAGFRFVLPAPDMKKNYVFKIRTRLECVNEKWSEWSPEKYWKNDTVPCSADTSTVSIKDYVLVTVLPVVFLLILYAATQKRIRRLVLPIIPDPKNTQESILNIEQFQWFTSFSQECEECEMVEIELVPQSEEEESEMTDELSPQKPTDTVPESHDLDPTTNTSLYFAYPSDSPEDSEAPQCLHAMPGYITI
ncbi:cytokine receptor common subunit gamma-like [Astyanax mexicanus]|uniref:Cytokine receptor common subunit gamma-like n=1 Tax=Astyanax mexicanus TaxID=7994 RepID=A0A8B9LM66_ASTMX|nr:cytokine receptor common subunit gamma-like [Astyanax mexicanus]